MGLLTFVTHCTVHILLFSVQMHQHSSIMDYEYTNTLSSYHSWEGHQFTCPPLHMSTFFSWPLMNSFFQNPLSIILIPAVAEFFMYYNHVTASPLSYTKLILHFQFPDNQGRERFRVLPHHSFWSPVQDNLSFLVTTSHPAHSTQMGWNSAGFNLVSALNCSADKAMLPCCAVTPTTFL